MMEVLRIYLSTVYKHDSKLLNTLFTDSLAPKVVEPLGPDEEVKIDTDEKIVMKEDSKVVTTISRFKDIIYNERIKQWICKEKSLQAAIRFL